MKYFGLHSEGDNFLLAVLNRKLKPLFLATFAKNKKINLGWRLLFQRKKFAAGLKSSDVLIKKTSLQIKNKLHAEKALKLQSESLFPFENKPSVIIPICTENNKQEKKYFLYGTTVSKVRKSLYSFEERKINLDLLCFEPMALARFAKEYFNSYKLSFIIHLESNRTICVFLENGYPIFSHSIKIGKNHLFQNLDLETPFDLELIDESKSDSTSTKWSQFKSKINQVFLSIKTTEKVYVLLTGDFENILNVEKFLFPNSLKDLLLYGKEKVSYEEFKAVQKYAVSIGYSISAVKSDQKSLQFLQKECLSKKTFFSFYKKAICTTACSFFFLLLSLQFQHKHANIKTNAIIKKFEELTKIDEKQMNRTINYDNAKTLSSKMDLFHDVISKENSFFPFIFNKSKPSEIIDKILRMTDDVELKNFQYKTESCPSLKNLYSKLLVKVTLHLHGKMNDVNVFCDKIFNQSFVNQKKQKEHTFEGNSHIVSFYLK